MKQMPMLTRQTVLTHPDHRTSRGLGGGEGEAGHGGHVAVLSLADFVNALTPEPQGKGLVGFLACLSQTEDTGNIEGTGLHMFLFCSRAKESRDRVARGLREL